MVSVVIFICSGRMFQINTAEAALQTMGKDLYSFETMGWFSLRSCNGLLDIIKQHVDFISSPSSLHKAIALKCVVLNLYNEILRATSNSLSLQVDYYSLHSLVEVLIEGHYLKRWCGMTLR